MFEEILRALKDSKGPLTVRELAGRIGVEESALEGMLDFLERKGRLSVYRPGECDESGPERCTGCVYRGGCPSTGSGAGGSGERNRT